MIFLVKCLQGGIIQFKTAKHWVQQVYYKMIRTAKMPGCRGHECQVVFNMGAAEKNNLTFFTAIIFILVLLFTETFGQIVQNGGFESGK